MKKIISLLIFIVVIVSSCDLFKLDNFPEPNAKFYGAIKDEVGGALVETDLVNGSTISAYEQGFDNPVLQSWLIKNNGEFRNDLVYANTYKLVFENCNFFPFSEDSFIIKPGENQHDFTVVPYIRIKNCSITHDVPGNKIVATFNLEGGNPTVKLSKITLYAFTDIYVGEYIKLSLSSGTTQFTRTFNPAIEINPSTNYTLSIDLAANANRFAVHRNYYFRVGALASQSGVGTVRYNYVPCIKIAL